MNQQPMQQQQLQQQQPQNQFMPRGVINKQWRPQAPPASAQPSTSASDLVRSVPVFQANLQPAPPIPPENVVSDAEKITQANYESWLNQQNNSLQEQLRYYETEILELRKLKKSLNTKQRQLKKNGNELNEVDTKTLTQVTQEQATVQKYLESARKQARNHLATKQDYDAKKAAKQMANNPHMVSSPAGQMNDQSPMMSPSPGGMNQGLNQQPVQSPLGNPIMAPSQSPLHSPSPMMSQSPGPASIMQSPGAHMNAMSPYNTMQQSPRIGTPHSQIEDSPFSPNSAQIDSPSMSGRLTSPAPRMTSPQHRPSTPMQMMSRMGNNAGQFNQQNVGMGQQTRFVRPQQMMPNDGSNRMNMRMPGNFQQQISHSPNLVRQGSYNAIDGNQIQNQQNIQMQQGQNIDPQMRQMQIRHQMQIRQQLMNQQAQMGQMNQMNQQNPQMMQQGQQQNPQMMQQGQQNPQMMQQGQQNPQMMQQVQQNPQMMQQGPQNPQMMQQVQQNSQMMPNQPNQSPSHQQPQSPLINQNASSPMPRSPMVHYQQQQHQNPHSPMMMDNSPRPSYMQQQQQQHQGMMDHNIPNQNMMQGGGGGGGNGMHNPNPVPPQFRFSKIKLGLRGGSPMWGNNSNNGNGNRSNADVLQIIKKAQQVQAAAQAQQSSSREEAQKVAGKVLPTGEQQASTSKTPQAKAKTSLLKKPPASIASSKIKSLVSTDYNDDDSSNGTPPISPLSQKNRLKAQSSKTDDVVVVDSSPDEKQRMLDYDDDNDKVVTTLTEVSLNSTAQDIGDSDDMIEAFDRSELISSPLVTEPEATDYVLFEPHVVHIDDSDESLKEIMSTNLFDEAMHQDHPKSDSSKSTNPSSEIMFVVDPNKEKLGKNVGTSEDFEAMIDSGKDDDESEPETTTVSKVAPTRKSPEAQAVKTVTTTIQDVKKEVKLPSIVTTTPSVSITLPANLISRGNVHTSMAGVSAHKKLVKNTTPTTAKVSIGNTTISVPVVLKNMPMQQNKQGDPQQGSKKIMTSNPLTISNVKKNPALFSLSGQKINTSTIVTLSLNKGASRPIQTVQRFQQKPGQQTQSIIVPISSCITSSPSSHIISSVGMVSSAQNSVTSKMSTSRASPVLTFSSKMPTLTMTQDASLPSKIFEDEEISPENFVELEESEKKGQEASTSKAADGLKDVQDDFKKGEPTAEEKQRSLIPVHVITKSRESSHSPVLNPAQRLLAGNMSQLSPLSQPIEINTNTHNATQQIRSIMSSINSNEDTKSKSEAEQTIVVSTSSLTQQNIPKTILRSVSTPTTSGQAGSELRMIVSQQNSSVPSSPNVQTSQAGNILFVKQIRTPSTQSVTIPSSTNSTIVVMSQPGQIQSQGSVIISNKPSNLLSILSNQQSSSVKNSELKMEPSITSSATSSSGETIGVQKTITILKTSPAITNLLNNSSFKRSKSTDDASTAKDSVEIAAAKRLSLESSNTIKSEPVELPTVKEVFVALPKQEQSQPQTLPSPCPPKSLIPPTSKPEDSQNVLLKQLLQNSGSVTSPLTRSVPGISSNQRAPSLGVFSSLEAQLARPVIPPAPAKPIIISSQPLVNQPPMTTISTSSPIMELSPKNTTGTKVVSRETSFVSQPSPVIATSTPSSTVNIPINIQSMMEKKPVVILNRNDIPASMMVQGSSSMSQMVSFIKHSR